MNTVINKIIEYINNHKHENIDEYLKSSNTKFITIIGVAFQVTKLQPSGASFGPMLEVFVKKQQVIVYKENDNLCLFVSITSLFGTSSKNQVKYLKTESRKLYHQYFNKKFSKKNNFQGIPLEYNTCKLIGDKFKINFIIYSYTK